MNKYNHLIIFDDDCIMCNKFIQFVVHHDRGRFHLARRNSAFVINSAIIPSKYQHTDSIILIQEKRVYVKASAIAQILLSTSFLGKVAGFMISCVPSGISDYFYTLIALRRKKHITASKDHCEINNSIQQRIIYQ